MSRVVLAGYNVDADILAEALPDTLLTPETLSAAYARISRDPRPVRDLRHAAAQEIEKARSSNRRIVFDMGHHSVAEHAVLNFDVTDVSRLVVEAIQSHRLASFTEKSQRYVRLTGGYVTPPEIRGSRFEDRFHTFVEGCFKRYHLLCEALSRSGIDEKVAGEDARYVLPLCVSTQMGMTVNARTLEYLVASLAGHPLQEAVELGAEFLAAGRMVVPSLMRHYEPTRRSREAPAAMADVVRSLLPSEPGGMEQDADASPSMRTIHATPQGDVVILAALVNETHGWPFETALERVASLCEVQRIQLFKAATQGLSVHDPLPRVFEHATLTVQFMVSSAAFGQLKRHRMASISAMPYDPSLGITVPPSIAKADLEGTLQEALQDAVEFWEALGGKDSPFAAYALLNMNRRRVLMTLNLREIHHISRLREDAHAQWDIRALAGELSGLARLAFPICASLLGGKDRWP